MRWFSACAYLQHPKFCALPDNEDMAVIEHSPNYADGQFRNQVPTQILTDDSGFVSVLLSNLLTGGDRLVPQTWLSARSR